MIRNPLTYILAGLLLAIWLLAPAPAALQAQTNQTPVVITLTAVATPTAVGDVPPDAYEPNDDPATATTIGLGTLPDLTLAGADIDTFTLYLKAGQTIEVATAVSGSLDTRLRLFWGGRPVAENDDAGPTDVGSLATWTAPADGWLVIQVEKATVYDGYYALSARLTAPPATETSAPTATLVPTLTPSPTGTPTPSPTPPVAPDFAEPNDTTAAAWPLAPGAWETYSLTPGDVDAFTFVAKVGQTYACATETAQVDTLLAVADAAGVITANDDRAPGALDSFVTWTAAAEGPVWVTVSAHGNGFGLYDFGCEVVLPAGPPPAVPGGAATPTGSGSANPAGSAAAPTMTPAPILTNTASLSLTVQYLGQAAPTGMDAAGPGTVGPDTATYVRLLIYYDANNDRAPGPGEGVAAVPVLAVDAGGRWLAETVTNAQGEAVFNLGEAAVDRIIVPFVSGWSARVRPGERNEGIVLGLPAVRLPVFLPVGLPAAAEEG